MAQASEPSIPGMVQLWLLGVPRWTVSGGAERRLAAVDALLLAMLALDGPLARAQLAARLWPDGTPQQASLNLRQRLFRLKQAAGSPLVAGDAVIRLAPGVVHDLQSPEPALAAEPSSGSAELLQGIDPDDGAAGDWLQAARRRWRDAWLRTLAALAEAHLAQGRIAAALPFAERLVAEAPASEHAHRRLMRLHHLRGDRAAALAAYAHCRQWLAQAMQTSPGPETESLAAQIAASPPPGSPAPQAAAPVPLALLRPPRLVGREAALQAVDAARALGQHLLFVGEPGIGKSRLLLELAARAGVDVIEARPHDAAQPYAVASRLVASWHRRCGLPADAAAVATWARLLPALGDAADGPVDGGHLALALRAWAAHAAAAGVPAWIVDDLQFADAASLALFIGMAGADAMPQAVLAVRAGEQPAELRRWLDGAAADALQVVPLAALSADEVSELLGSLALPGLEPLSWGQALWRHVGGNPFHTLQTVLACDVSAAPPAVLPVPRHLQSMVLRRLARLDESAQRLARLAAVAGGDFDAPLAAAVLGTHVVDLAPAWQALQDAQFVDTRGFTHDLLREATLSAVPAAIAQALHRQIARAGSALGMAPQRVAGHAWQGADWALACDAAQAAAELAARQGLPMQQLELLDRAAEAAQRTGDARRRFALAHQACLVAHEVEPAASVQHRLQGLDLLAEDPAQRLDAALARTRWLGYRGDWPAMRDAADAAAAMAAAVPERQFEAACLRAAALSQNGQHAEALAGLMPWQAAAATHADARLRHDWHSNFGYVLAAVNRRRESVDATERALAEAQALGDLPQALTHATNLAGMLSQGGDLDAALARAQLAAALRERLGNAPGLMSSVAEMNLGLIEARLGRFDDALHRLEPALACFEADPSAVRWAQVARNHLAALWLGLGQTARAQALLARQPPEQWRAVVLRARLPGADRAAPAALRQALDAARQLTERLGLMIELAAHESPDLSCELAAQAAAQADAGQLDAYALAARLRQASALSRLGRHGQAAAAAEAVETELEAGRHAFDLSPADCALSLGELWAAAGDPERAEAARDRGRRWLRDEVLPRLSPMFRDACQHRQPVHRALLVGGGFTAQAAPNHPR